MNSEAQSPSSAAQQQNVPIHLSKDKTGLVIIQD